MISTKSSLAGPAPSYCERRRVLAIGVFDLFHIGHLRYLNYARAQGSHLTVAVSPDALSLAIKHKLPVVSQAERLEIVRDLRSVDEARLQPVSTEYAQEAAEWIAAWNIDLVVGGGCWKDSERWARLIPALAARGIKVTFAPATEGVSTTALLDRIHQRHGNRFAG